MNPIISFNDCDFYNGFFYAASDKENTFFRFNGEKYEKLFDFDDEESIECLFMQSIMVNDKIILTPSNAQNIYVYDCGKEKLTPIFLKGSDGIRPKFHGVFVYGNFAYFFPVTYPHMVRLNMENGEIDYIELGCILPAELNYAQEINGFLISYKLYSKYIFEISLHDHSTLLQKKNIVCKNIWGYCVYGGYDYFVTDIGIQIIKDDDLVFEDKKHVLNNGIYLFTPYIYHDKVMFFPFSTGGHTSAVPIVIENKSNNDFLLRELNGGGATCFHCIKEYDGKLYMLRDSDCSVVMFDPEYEVFDVYIKGTLREIEQERKSCGLEEWINLQLM